MLPYDVWFHYHDQPCEFCDNKVNPREEEMIFCDFCKKLICDDCRESVECDVCNEKQYLDDEYEGVCDVVCMECMKYCSECNVTFHPSCQEEHAKNCNPEGRAQSAWIAANRDVEEKEFAIVQHKRKLIDLEQELVKARNVMKQTAKKIRKS